MPLSTFNHREMSTLRSIEEYKSQGLELLEDIIDSLIEPLITYRQNVIFALTNNAKLAANPTLKCSLLQGLIITYEHFKELKELETTEQRIVKYFGSGSIYSTISFLSNFAHESHTELSESNYNAEFTLKALHKITTLERVLSNSTVNFSVIADQIFEFFTHNAPYIFDLELIFTANFLRDLKDLDDKRRKFNLDLKDFIRYLKESLVDAGIICVDESARMSGLEITAADCIDDKALMEKFNAMPEQRQTLIELSKYDSKFRIRYERRVAYFQYYVSLQTKIDSIPGARRTLSYAQGLDRAIKFNPGLCHGGMVTLLRTQPAIANNQQNFVYKTYSDLHQMTMTTEVVTNQNSQFSFFQKSQGRYFISEVYGISEANSDNSALLPGYFQILKTRGWVGFFSNLIFDLINSKNRLINIGINSTAKIILHILDGKIGYAIGFDAAAFKKKFELNDKPSILDSSAKKVWGFAGKIIDDVFNLSNKICANSGAAKIIAHLSLEEGGGHAIGFDATQISVNEIALRCIDLNGGEFNLQYIIGNKYDKNVIINWLFEYFMCLGYKEYDKYEIYLDYQKSIAGQQYISGVLSLVSKSVRPEAPLFRMLFDKLDDPNNNAFHSRNDAQLRNKLGKLRAVLNNGDNSEEVIENLFATYSKIHYKTLNDHYVALVSLVYIDYDSQGDMIFAKSCFIRAREILEICNSYEIFKDSIIYNFYKVIIELVLISIEVNNVENTLKSKVIIAILQEKFKVHDELLSQSRTFIEKIKGMNKVAVEQGLQNIVNDLVAKYYGPCVRELEAAAQTDEKSKELIELIGLVDDTKYLLPEDKKESLAMTLVHKHPCIIDVSDQQKLPLLAMFNNSIPRVLKDSSSTSESLVSINLGSKRKKSIPG